MGHKRPSPDLEKHMEEHTHAVGEVANEGYGMGFRSPSPGPLSPYIARSTACSSIRWINRKYSTGRTFYAARVAHLHFNMQSGRLASADPKIKSFP